MTIFLDALFRIVQVTTNPEVLGVVDEKAKQLSDLLASCLTSKGVQRFTLDQAKSVQVGTVTVEVRE